MTSNLNDAALEPKEERLRTEYVVFRNKGLLDPKMIKTFGISAKSPDNPNPIGYFGTGLKYAIAVLLRHDIPISIFAGDREYTFQTKKECFRGKDFELVLMDGEELGFTTELGKNWELWQAFRELYSNCIDELGQISKEECEPHALEGLTQVSVKSEKFVEIYENRHEIFLQGDPLVKNKNADIYGGTSNSVFYRGIRIASFKTPLMYKYNIQKHLDLTEDRTVAYSWQINDSIVDAVTSSTDKKLIEDVLMAPDGSHEAGLNFLDNRESQSDEFKEVAAYLRRTKPEKMNRSALDLFERDLPTQDKFARHQPNQAEQAQLADAIDFLTEMGYNVDKYSVICLKSMGETTLALAENNTIYLSQILFDKGTKYLTATIFEEFVHLEYGYDDCSRSMQNFLFERMMTLMEQVLGKEL